MFLFENLACIVIIIIDILFNQYYSLRAQIKIVVVAVDAFSPKTMENADESGALENSFRSGAFLKSIVVKTLLF